MRSNLVVDDAPGVRHQGVVLPCKGMVASARSCKGVAGDLHISLLAVKQLFADVKGCQGGQCSA